MSNVFISQPMGGKTEEEIYHERERAMVKLMSLYPDHEIHIMDTYIQEEPDEDVIHDGAWYLGISILFSILCGYRIIRKRMG